MPDTLTPSVKSENQKNCAIGNETSADVRRLGKARAGLLRHPLTIVILSSLLSTLLIPAFAAWMNDRKLISVARLNTSISILENSTATNRALNSLITTAGMFMNDTDVAGGVSQKDRDGLRADLARNYLEFDRQAWWWHMQLANEARLLRVPINAQTESVIQQYQSNLIASIAEFTKLWRKCLSKRYKPNSRNNRQLLNSTRDHLRALQIARDQLVGTLVSQFAPAEPGILDSLQQTRQRIAH